MTEVTELLAAARAGGEPAIGRLFELLYPELSRIARARLRQVDQRMMLDTVALVNETYLRLLKLNQLSLQDRPHFLAYSARVMRSVIVDLARSLQVERRGGELAFVTLDTAADCMPSRTDEVVEVHEALLDLERIEPRLTRVVEMRYFVGMECAEIAQALGVGLRTVERDWEKARGFLYHALNAR
ncbi:MAG: ECF-type sigma factor [Burkholderiaceae bacterium]